MANSSWFDESYYLSAKATYNNANAIGGLTTWTPASVQASLNAAGMTAQQHYTQYGWTEGLAPNAYYVESQYVTSKVAALNAGAVNGKTDWTNADFYASLNGANPFMHYVQYGAYETGVEPSTGFNDDTYYADKATYNNTNAVGGITTWTAATVKAAFQSAGLTPIGHYELYGATENFYTPNPTPTPGQTYTLTTGTDTASATLFNAPNQISPLGAPLDTLQSVDTLTGLGTGATLNADIGTAIVARPTMTNISNVNLANTSGAGIAIDFSATTGMTALSLDGNGLIGGSMTAANVGNIVDIAAKNMLGAGVNDAVYFADSVLKGSADALNVTLTNDGVSSTAPTGRLNFAGTTSAGGGAETLNVSLVGANYITGLSSQGGLALGVAATSASNSVNTYNFSGADASISVADQLFHATTIDGSGLTGTGHMSVSADINKDVTVTGGAGDDSVNFTTGLTNADKYDGGTGRDTIRVTSATGAGLGTGNQISNVEILRTDGASAFTFDHDKLTTIDAIVNNSTGAMIYQNMTGSDAADATKGLTLLNGLTTEYDIKGATVATSTADTLAVNIGTKTGSTGVNAAAPLTAGSLNSAGLDILNINVVANDHTNGGATATTLGDINDAGGNTLTTLNLTGGEAGSTFTINANAAVTAAALKTINAADFTSNLVVTGGNVANSAITGGSGNDQLTGGTSSDTIVGGAGDDTISGGADSDTLTGGTGTDTFIYTTPTDSSVTAALINVDNLTDFTSGTDKLDTNIAVSAITQGPAITAASTGATAASLILDLTTAGVTFGTTASVATITGAAGNAGTYLYEDSNASGTVNAGDLIVKLTGTSSTTLALGDFV